MLEWLNNYDPMSWYFTSPSDINFPNKWKKENDFLYINNGEIIDDEITGWKAKSYFEDDLIELKLKEKVKRFEERRHQNFIASCKLEGIDICQKKS